MKIDEKDFLIYQLQELKSIIYKMNFKIDVLEEYIKGYEGDKNEFKKDNT